MTSGPEHYREAERLLAEAADLPNLLVHFNRDDVSPDVVEEARRRLAELLPGKKPLITASPATVDVSGKLAAAQVHATLALAAATVLPAIDRRLGDERLAADREWIQVTA